MRRMALILVAASAFAAGPEVFELRVVRVMAGRDRPGSLRVDASGVSFRSADKKHDVAIAMKNLRAADVADFRALRFGEYAVDEWKPGKRRETTFRAEAGTPVEAMAEFLASRIYRSVVGHYGDDRAVPRFTVDGFHGGLRSGANGRLEIGDDAIRFVSEKAADSRTWVWRDVETLGRPDKFRFRVTTARESYVVELKGELGEDAFQFAWGKVYGK